MRNSLLRRAVRLGSFNAAARHHYNRNSSSSNSSSNSASENVRDSGQPVQFREDIFYKGGPHRLTLKRALKTWYRRRILQQPLVPPAQGTLQSSAAAEGQTATAPSTRAITTVTAAMEGIRLLWRSFARLLFMIERPARDAFALARFILETAGRVGGSLAELFADVYCTFMSPALRRLLRFAIGVPFLCGTVFLLGMHQWYFPEIGDGLDTSCVAEEELCGDVAALLVFTVQLQKFYRDLQQHYTDVCARQLDAGQSPPGGETKTASVPPASMLRKQGLAASTATFSAEESNELLRRIFIVIRSMEECMVGTAEERVLITRQPDVLGGPRPTMSPEATPGPSPATAAGAKPAPRIIISPAEYILRVILAISLEQGWADITEHARQLFSELVHTTPVPAQAHIVQAVGDLCSLSYELEQGQVDAITRSQRRRVARAIDAFRPEKAVEERCTIASEITILPIPDSDHTTRCLGMIRHSPGRRPQLILCFLGSNSWRNWVTNFNYFPIPLPSSFGVRGHGCQPMVHRGFYGLLQSVPYKELAADFDQIILVGHSLGGALAQLAGLELAAEKPGRRITVVTMASPRVLAIDGRVHRDFNARRTMQQRRNPLAVVPSATSNGIANEHQRDDLAELLSLPPNYRHFRGFLQPDAVPHLPPQFLHFTHTGQRLPLNTGCHTFSSFIGWGMWSYLYHSSDLYYRVLQSPCVSQSSWYFNDAEDDLVDPEEVRMGLV